MPIISKVKKDKISEQILHYLFTISPESAYTNRISSEIARDEEFIKTLLLELEKNKLVILINKNSKGTKYSKRQRWRLSPQAYDIYRARQTSQSLVSRSLEESNNP